jgi:hypothetical protein
LANRAGFLVNVIDAGGRQSDQRDELGRIERIRESSHDFARIPPRKDRAKSTFETSLKQGIIREHPMTSLRVCDSPLSPVVSARPVCPTVSARLALHRFLLAIVALAALIGTAPTVEAAPRRAKSHAKAKHSSRASTRAAATAKAKADAAEAAVAGKVAVFAFQGEDTYSVREHVIQALTDRGIKVEATIPPVDTTEQYRDMGAVMNLAAYVHGHVKELPADHAVATIVIRSGVTGRKLTSVTFTGYRRGLPYDVEEKLWQRLGPAFRRACVEATKPRPHHNKPMVIEAGTPL